MTVNQSPYFLRARYYDPVIGRFLTRDPWPANAAIAQSLNRYAYVLNNPTLLLDPTGLVCVGPLCSSSVTDPIEAAAGAVAGYVSDKAQDLNTGVQDTLDNPATAPQNSLAFMISLFSNGDRKTFQNGFVYYEHCKGMCSLIGGILGSPDAYTPGYIAFSTRELVQSVVWHEYQHYLQSQMLGPLYLPGVAISALMFGYWNSPLEVDARRAECDQESHAPFNWPNKSIYQYNSWDWANAFWRALP